MQIGECFRLVNVKFSFLTTYESPITCDLGFDLCYTQPQQLNCLTSYNYSIYTLSYEYSISLRSTIMITMTLSILFPSASSATAFQYEQSWNPRVVYSQQLIIDLNEFRQVR